jgi:hypothetical protein
MGHAYVSVLWCCPLNLGWTLSHPSKTVNKPLISHYGYYRRILMNIIIYIYYGSKYYRNYWTLYTIPQYRCCIGLLHLLLKRWRGGGGKYHEGRPLRRSWSKSLDVELNEDHGHLFKVCYTTCGTTEKCMMYIQNNRNVQYFSADRDHILL